MDVSVLRKRLKTYKSGKKGMLRNVGDDVVLDVLRAWENWPGKATELYRELDLSKMQLVTMIQKGKKLVKNGVVSNSEFAELKAMPAGVGDFSVSSSASGAIELSWDNGRMIRFFNVDHLLDFLRKVA